MRWREGFLHLGQPLKQLLDLLPGQTLNGGVHDLPGERNELCLQRAALRREMDMPFPAVLLVWTRRTSPFFSMFRKRIFRLTHGSSRVQI